MSWTVIFQEASACVSVRVLGVKRTLMPSLGRKTSSPRRTKSSRFSSDSTWKWRNNVDKITFCDIIAYFCPINMFTRKNNKFSFNYDRLLFLYQCNFSDQRWKERSSTGVCPWRYPDESGRDRSVQDRESELGRGATSRQPEPPMNQQGPHSRLNHNLCKFNLFTFLMWYENLSNNSHNDCSFCDAINSFENLWKSTINHFKINY